MRARGTIDAGPRRPRRKIRKLRLAVIFLALGLLGCGGFSLGIVTALGGQLPQLDPARQTALEQNGAIYAADGKTVLAVLRGDQSRVVVASEAISPLIKQAIVAVEDRRFFEHRGIDLRGIARAVWDNLVQGRVEQGGSTITQQLVKNAYVTNEKTVARKLREAALAWQLEQRWPKDRILTGYLNTIYFGNGAYGVQQAAQTYFGVGAGDLTLAQAALLAGIPADPSRFDPVTNPRATIARRKIVLDAMLSEGAFALRDYRAALHTPLPSPSEIHLPGVEGPAQHFVNYVKQQLVDRYGSAKVFGGGLHVRTTLDLDLQRLAREAIEKWLPSGNGPAAALVAIDPRDGSLIAMVGGNNYRRSQFNLAVQGERQAGSAFKPFVLATALEQGISPFSVFPSKPLTIPLGDRLWAVRNYENAYLGKADLIKATAESDNTVFAQLTTIVQPRNVADLAHRLGVTRPLDSFFAIGLGADPVSPLEMARAYATLANGGQRVDSRLFGDRPRAIAAVGTTANTPVPRTAVSRATASAVTAILRDVITKGTGLRAALADRPVAGKTGTTENYGDAWFVGYTPQLAVAVWVGYPDGLKPMLHEFEGKAVTGGSFPALIFKTFAEAALAQLNLAPATLPFLSVPPATPASVVSRDGRLLLDNGRCRNVATVLFVSGAAPRATADCRRNEVEVPLVVGETVDVATARLRGQPLTPTFVYKPAQPGQRVDIVLGQFPRSGRLSSFDHVQLVVARATNGLVPQVVGMRLPSARQALAQLQLSSRLSPVGHTAGAQVGTVLAQRPAAGVAAAPGMPVTLVVAAG